MNSDKIPTRMEFGDEFYPNTNLDMNYFQILTGKRYGYEYVKAEKVI